MMEEPMRRGLYRIHGADDRSDDVRIDDDGIELPMAESAYRARGYLPSADDLPWKEDYLCREPSADTEKAARQQARQEFVERVRNNRAR